jgi:hypothetical protein
MGLIQMPPLCVCVIKMDLFCFDNVLTSYVTNLTIELRTSDESEREIYRPLSTALYESLQRRLKIINIKTLNQKQQDRVNYRRQAFNAIQDCYKSIRKHWVELEKEFDKSDTHVHVSFDCCINKDPPFQNRVHDVLSMRHQERQESADLLWNIWLQLKEVMARIDQR